MGAWQSLPDGLPPEVRHFVELLRQLKDGTGLSLAALGARTAYSKSSWQRYLNAVQPPPRQAVSALCRVAGLTGADIERHVVRWELAVEVWPRPVLTEPGPGDYEDDPTVPWWDRPQETAPERTGAVGQLLLYAVVLLLTLLLAAVGGAVVFG